MFIFITISFLSFINVISIPLKYVFNINFHITFHLNDKTRIYTILTFDADPTEDTYSQLDSLVCNMVDECV